jgi:hypothetical protein
MPELLTATLQHLQEVVHLKQLMSRLPTLGSTRKWSRVKVITPTAPGEARGRRRSGTKTAFGVGEIAVGSYWNREAVLGAARRALLSAT